MVPQSGSARCKPHGCCAPEIAPARAPVHSVLVRFSSAFAITSPPRQTLPAGVDAELMPTVPKSVRVRVTGSHRVGGVALGRRRSRAGWLGRKSNRPNPRLLGRLLIG